MRKWLAMLRPNPAWTRRFMLLAVVAAVGMGAFCLGRHGAVPEPGDQSGGANPPRIVYASGTVKATANDPAQRVVAYIYDNIPVTREELGEYLISRFGQERVEFLINRKIVEMQCKNRGIEINESMVDAQLIEDIKSFSKDMTLDLFVKQVLGRFKKTLYEWREDVIRPKLALTELVKPLVKVTPDDVQNEFEARYGPKVQCRMIVFQKGDAHMQKIWEHARQSEAAFKEEATKQFIPELASRSGEVPPIHKHFPDAAIEEAAFRLKEGDVSGLIKVKQDETWVLLRCEKHIPADLSKRFEAERFKLFDEVSQRKLAMEIPKVFQQMRDQARPKNLMQPAAQVAGPAPKLIVPPPVAN